MRPLCSAGDRFVAGGSDNLKCWLFGLLGFECKTDLQRAQDCAKHLKSTTGKDHYIDAQFATGGGETSYYYAVLEGKR